MTRKANIIIAIYESQDKKLMKFLQVHMQYHVPLAFRKKCRELEFVRKME